MRKLLVFCTVTMLLLLLLPVSTLACAQSIKLVPSTCSYTTFFGSRGEMGPCIEFTCQNGITHNIETNGASSFEMDLKTTVNGTTCEHKMKFYNINYSRGEIISFEAEIDGKHYTYP